MPKHLSPWLFHHQWLPPKEHFYQQSTKFLEACHNFCFSNWFIFFHVSASSLCNPHKLSEEDKMGAKDWWVLKSQEEKHTALLYAIEASSVASRRYFLQTRVSLINAHIWIKAEYIIEKCHLLNTLFYGAPVSNPECKFQGGGYAPKP